MDPNRLKIEQMTRILETFGWKVVATSTEGNDIRMTIQAPKAEGFK